MADEQPLRIDCHVQVQRAVSLEALARLLHQDIAEAAGAGRKALSVSHAVNQDDEEGKPFSYVLLTESRFPSKTE